MPWEKGEALKAAKSCFDAWLSIGGGAGAAEDTAIVEQVTLFIEQHGASRFQDVGKPDSPCINRVGFRRTNESGNTVYYVLPESFKELCKGHDVGRAARVLRDKGLLIPDGKHLKRYSPILPEFGRQCCYTLNVSNGGNENETS